MEYTYTHLFETLKDECVKMGYWFQSKFVVADFGKAIHMATREASVSRITLIGWRFHVKLGKYNM
jgi:hypothetical protein